MRRSSIVAGLSLLTLPLTAALCCYPREDFLPVPVLDRSSLLHHWRLERATCFCTEFCPPDSASRPYTLHLAADNRYQRSSQPPVRLLEEGTWMLSGSKVLVLTGPDGFGRTYQLDFLTGSFENPTVGDSLYLTTSNSTTECRRLVFSKVPQ